MWGASLLKLRCLVCLLMIAVTPVSLLADDAAAMLRSNGVGVQLNKNSAPASTALFPRDLIETQQNAAARIEASGSTADVDQQTMVQFDGDELALDHGRLSVNTSRGMRVRVGCLTIRPVNNTEWTHYDVADVNGKVTVSALKNDVSIDSRSGNLKELKQGGGRSSQIIVREGEQKSRDEKCGGDYDRGSRPAPGNGAILNSPWAKGAGAVIIGGLICLGLCHHDDPISPSRP